VFRAAVDAASAPRLLDTALLLPEHGRLVGGRRLVVLAVGKASAPMAAAFARGRAGRIAAGLVVGTHCSVDLPSPFRWHAAGHPIPDERSVEAGRLALALAAEVPDDGVFVVLLSGGASALLALPRPGLTLADKRAATRQLLGTGADIRAVNTVRKHLSAIKGGQLVTGVRGDTLAFAVSDVVGDDLSVIGSGPTVPDPATFVDAWAVIEACGGRDAFPRAVTAHLRAGVEGRAAETPKPGDPRFARVTSRVIGSRADAVRGAVEAAGSLGYRTAVIAEPTAGEARAAGPLFVDRATELARGLREPTCVVAAGETVVRVTGPGRGGRNQELVLSAVPALAVLDRPAALLSGGTDGIDGPTDAAGATADATTAERARAAGLDDPDRYLRDNDSFRFFHALGDLVVIGPTDTNVGDVQILLVGGVDSRSNRC
jgi:glycerate 2-kinase